MWMVIFLFSIKKVWFKLRYISANNLYGSMETRMLPVGNFKWVPKKEIKTWTDKDILNLPSQSRIGYAFEVDLHYPKKYHAVNNCFC